MSTLSKKLRADRKKIVDEMQVLIANEAMTDEQNAKFNELDAEQQKLKNRIDADEKTETLVSEMNARHDRKANESGKSKDEVTHEESELEAAYNSWLRNGFGGLSDEHRAIANGRIGQIQGAQSVGTNTAGGYTVPQGFYDQLIDAELAYGGMLTAGFTIDTESGAALPVPTDNDTSNSGALLSENTQAGTQDMTFNAVTLNAYMYTSKIVLVSLQLLNDSAFDLNTFLAGKLGTRIGRAINTHFTVGTGSSQPNGVITAATAGPVGATGQTTSIIYDDLVNLEHSVDPAYRLNPKSGFMMADSSLKVIKKLKDSQGRPLWMAGLTEKAPDTILGYGYTINQDMAAMAANAKSVAFGDFSKYWMRRVAGAQVLRLTERYADYAQVGFVAFQRWDGQLIDAGTHPIKYYANSAT